MINVAKEALKNHELNNVIVIEYPPRFDQKLKSELAIFANSVLNQLIENSGIDRIKLGSHKLICVGVGKTFDARYRNPLSKRMDGLHFFGPLGVRSYSESLIDILTVNNRIEFLSQGNL